MDYAIFGNAYQGAYLKQLAAFFDALRSAAEGTRLGIDEPFMRWLISEGVSLPADIIPFDGDDFGGRLCLSLGGDGTLLHAARRIGRRQIPVMGINTGHLGYLTTAGLDDPTATARMVASSDYHIDDRRMLCAGFKRNGLEAGIAALNEVAVTKLDSASTVTVDAWVDGTLLASCSADGLLVSTPTGSTGYNLSVGGPVVAPHSPVWIVSPIAPHSLTMRPVVIPDTASITLRVSSRSGSYLLSYDGVPEVLDTDTVVVLSKAPYVTRIAIARGVTFTDTLRDKLSWGK